MTYLFDESDQVCGRTNKSFNKCIYTFQFFWLSLFHQKNAHEGNRVPKSA